MPRARIRRRPSSIAAREPASPVRGEGADRLEAPDAVVRVDPDAGERRDLAVRRDEHDPFRRKLGLGARYDIEDESVRQRRHHHRIVERTHEHVVPHAVLLEAERVQRRDPSVVADPDVDDRRVLAAGRLVVGRDSQHRDLGVGSPYGRAREHLERAVEAVADREPGDRVIVLPHADELRRITAARELLDDAVRDLADVAVATRPVVGDPLRERMLEARQIAVVVRARARRHQVRRRCPSRRDAIHIPSRPITTKYPACRSSPGPMTPSLSARRSATPWNSGVHSVTIWSQRGYVESG
jgi:hypothetical protein